MTARIGPLRCLCAELLLPFDAGWTEPILAHLELLERWAPRVNLTTVWDPEEALLRHVLDSLALLGLAPVRNARGAAVDVGSGAGFPGVPLAVAMPHVEWTLVEPRRKRAVFLRRVVAAASLRNVAVLETSVPDPGLCGRFALAVSRATLAPAAWLEAAAPLLAAGGHAVVMAAGPVVLEAGGGPWRLAEERGFEIAGAPRTVSAWERSSSAQARA